MANRAQGLTHFFAFVAGRWCASEPGNGLRASVDRPRAVTGAIVRRLGAAGTRPRTGNNLLSLNRGYNYGMINRIERGPFSELGDQQLLEQTKRLAANQRCLEVHILDHLDEIDRRGLALRRGFSSLFDYAVRELRFSDAAAQRRIQAMRLCRRHGCVRASLQCGELSMTSAGQLETTFAGAERAERQSTGHRNVGEGRGHRSEPGFTPPAAECSGDVRERGLRSAPGGAPPAGECCGDVTAGNTPAVPVGSRSGAQTPGAGHAGALLPRLELNGNAPPFPAPSCAPVTALGAGAAAPSSDEGHAPRLLPPTDFSASMPEPEPEPVMAAAESRNAAAHAPEPPRDDPFAELSPGTVSAAPLLHPQRQRELIEQAAGMSTRQVASLLAAAAPEVLPPRDTLRAVAPDRYTLKVSIDQECEQGLRLLKDLMSHVDPRMSWGDLIARVVREAVARHDPRGGGRGQRRKGADSAGASPRRTPKETRAAGAAGGPARRVGESTGREPNRTGAAGAAAGPAQRVDESSGRAHAAQNRTRADVAPVAAARRRGGATSAPQSAPAVLLDGARAGGVPAGASAATPAPSGDTAAIERQNPIEVLASAAPPSQSAPAAPSDGAHAGCTPAGDTAATAAPQFASGALADGSHAGARVPGSPVATAAPERAIGVCPDGGPSGASAGAAGGASAGGFSARAGVRGSPVVTSAPKSVLGGFPDGRPPDAAAGAAAHTGREPVHSRRESPRRRHIPAAVRRHIWLRDGGRCCYRDPLTGRRCTSAHLLQIDHLVPVAEGGGPEPSNLALRCFAHHRMRHGYGPAAPPQPPI